MRYGLIRFLNARPLWWGLVREPAGDIEYEFTSPARCSDLVADGSVDVGLIPAIDLVRIPGLMAVPGICIASRAEVRSVLLVSRVPFEEIRSVALDPASRSSVALTRILLGERLGRDRLEAIRFDPAEHGRRDFLEGHDAEVVIGDPALKVRQTGKGVTAIDLAAEWNRMVGEPFVFALWAGRADRIGENGRDLIDLLMRSRAKGLASLPEIVAEAAAELGLPEPELAEYFDSALHYDLGADERRALARFHSLAIEYGLVENPQEIEWLS